MLKITPELRLQLVNKVIQRSSGNLGVREMLSVFRWTKEMLVLLISPSAHLQGLSIPG